MIEEGALENPKVDAVMGLHLGNLGKEIPKGKIGVSYGIMMAAVDVMYIKNKWQGFSWCIPLINL